MMIETVLGYWNPLNFVIATLSTGLAFWIFGKLFFNQKTRESEPFFSGNKDKALVSGTSLYWGFLEAMEGYYDEIKKIHSKRFGDYAGWLYVVMAALFLLLLGGEML